MSAPPKTIAVQFSGIDNFPGIGFPFEVNRSFTLTKDKGNPGNYRFVGQPDGNCAWPVVHVAINGQDDYLVEFYLWFNNGNTQSMPFSGNGASPVNNVSGYYPNLPDMTLVPFGGTATIT